MTQNNLGRPSGRARFWPLLLLGFALLGFLIWRIGPAKMLTAWKSADHILLLPAAAMFIGAIFLRSVKWWVFLRAAGHPTGPMGCLQAYVHNAFLGNLTPARSGELLAPVWLSRHDVPLATGLAVVIVDRLLDLLVVLSLFFAALAIFSLRVPVGGEAVRGAGLLAAALTAVLIVVLVVAMWRLDLAERFLGRFGHRWADAVRTRLERFAVALRPFGTRRAILPNLAITLATWMMDVTSSFLVVRAFIGDLGYLDSFCGSLFSTMAAVLSMVPGGIGVGALGYTEVIDLLGHNAAAAGSAAILWTFATHAMRGTLALILVPTIPKK